MADKKKHYDVGLMGVWFGCNYGSIATYYALEKTIESFGLSVLMVHWPRTKPDDGRMKGRHSIRFAEEHYDISKSYHVSEIDELNDLCDIFVLGSDQIWNYGVTKSFGLSYFLDFTAPEKKRIAYSTSFGGTRRYGPREYTRKETECLRRMDAISVRESEGVGICKNLFGVKAEHLLDPVLMCDPQILSDLAEKSARREHGPYIAAYILDPTPEKREALLYAEKKLDKKLVNMLDGWYHLFPANKEKLGLPNTVEKLQVEEWICYFKYSDFVITDSFHGTCMAILFRKPFIAIGNPDRGASRFESLLKSVKLMNRYAARADQIPGSDALFTPVDYTEAYEILEKERVRSRKWLKDTLLGEKKNPRPSVFRKMWSALIRNIYCTYYYYEPIVSERIKGKARSLYHKIMKK